MTPSLLLGILALSANSTEPAATAITYPPVLTGSVSMGGGASLVVFETDGQEGYDASVRGWLKWNPWEYVGFRAMLQGTRIHDKDAVFYTEQLQSNFEMLVQPGWGRVRPYLASGFTMMQLQGLRKPQKGGNWTERQTIGVPVEAGLEVLVSEGVSLSAWYDTHAWLWSGDDFDGVNMGTGSDWEIRDKVSRIGAGLTFRLQPSRDIDRDGIPDKLDRCLNAPEDLDGFQDTDGCPDVDNDGDGLKDLQDRCPNDAEDTDLFQDEDGCPDVDNDQDGITDAVDKCPLVAEDRDGFQDDDGCADLDNDQDGVADLADKCLNEVEDRDGFEDTDGCPDLDNDRDGIADKTDVCANQAEDRDGFQDDDGCPEADNDADGIPDSQDRCPVDKEVVNGFSDEDGCPDVAVAVGKSMVLEGIVFKEGSAEVLPESRPILDKAATQLMASADVLVEIRGYTDNAGSDKVNQKLSQARAESVRQFLITLGVPANQVQAKGYGRLNPIESNATLAGRARNRRIEFYRIR